MSATPRPAQRADMFAPIYAELDRQAAAGVIEPGQIPVALPGGTTTMPVHHAAELIGRPEPDHD